MEEPEVVQFWGSLEAARFRLRGDPRGLRPRRSRGEPRERLRRAAARLLLPQGFPESVSPDYGRYQCWDSLQALCSSLSGSLSARAVLEAVGVGDGAASATGAALTWLLRDGVGIVTRIVFVWLQGGHLDCEAKQWRLVADLLNDVALVLEILAPHWLSLGPALLVMAAAARCVVGVAGGATRAALAVHQARRDNVADVAAKDSSQETLVNGVGLLLSLLLLPLLDGRPWLTWATLGLLLAAHLGANLAALSSLTLTSLNRPRLRLAIGWALRGGGAKGEKGVAWEGRGGVKLELPSPQQVNPREPLLPGLGSRLRLHLGAPLEHLVSSEAEFQKALECGSPDYIIVLRPSRGPAAGGAPGGGFGDRDPPGKAPGTPPEAPAELPAGRGSLGGPGRDLAALPGPWPRPPARVGGRRVGHEAPPAGRGRVEAAVGGATARPRPRRRPRPLREAAPILGGGKWRETDGGKKIKEFRGVLVEFW